MVRSRRSYKKDPSKGLPILELPIGSLVAPFWGYLLGFYKKELLRSPWVAILGRSLK